MVGLAWLPVVCEKALTIRKKIFGEHHADVATS